MVDNPDPFWSIVGILIAFVVIGAVVMASVQAIGGGGMGAFIGVALLIGLIKGFMGDKK